MTLSGLPAGITAGINPTQIAAGSSSTTIALAATSAATVGSSTVTVAASGTGVTATEASLTVAVTAAPAYSIAISPTPIVVQAGASANANISIARTNFTGTVALTLVTPPAGLVGVISPASTASDNSTLSLNAGASLAPGSYSVTLRGTSTGLADRTLSVPVTVNAPPGSITIALTPTTATVAQGLASQSNILIARASYAGAVAITTSTLPAGVSAAITNNNTSGNSASIAFNTSANTPVGSYAITVVASGTGINSVQATYNLNVAAAGSGVVADWEFCPDEAPVFFAVQDGAGAWQAVAPTIAGGIVKYRITLRQSYGGVTYVTRTSDALRQQRMVHATRALDRRMPRATPLLGVGRQLSRFGVTSRSGSVLQDVYSTSVTYATAAELTTTQPCTPASASKSVIGTVRGLAVSQRANFALGSSTASVSGTGGDLPVTFDFVSDGKLTLVGTRSLANTADRMVLLRDVDVANGGTISPVLDFAGSASLVPTTASIGVQNALGDSVILRSSLISADGVDHLAFEEPSPSLGATRTAVGVPTSRMLAGELHGLWLSASVSPGDFASDTRDVTRYVAAVSQQSLALGPRLPVPSLTVIGNSAYPRLRLQTGMPQEYRSISLILLADQNLTRFFDITTTGGYAAALGSNGSLDASIPDLSGLTSFPLASRLASGSNIAVHIALGSDIAVGIFGPSFVPVAGQTLWSASRSTQFLIP
ncbi:MAG: hypothetical protein IPJ56_01490 [Gemmatimonadetes bacterium]|nr:hypothetical protein [Gemmatimonadota bacterium]